MPDIFRTDQPSRLFARHVAFFAFARLRARVALVFVFVVLSSFVFLPAALPLSLPFTFGADKEKAEKTFQEAKTFLEAENYDAAAPLLHQAAKQGSAQALAELGNLYLKGKGVKRDLSRAQELYRKAAKQNNVEGMMGLAFMLEVACGFEKDGDKALKEALRWYRKAAKKGNVEAKKVLKMYDNPDAAGVTVRAFTIGLAKAFLCAKSQ